MNFDQFLALSDELFAELTSEKHGQKFHQSVNTAESVFESFNSSSVQSQTQDYENKIAALEREIEKVKGDTVPESEVLKIETELEQKKNEEIAVLEELRCFNGKLEEVDIQRASLEEKKINLQEREKNNVTTRDVLSMSASATQILFDLNDQLNISGSIVDKKKKRVETFKFPRSDTHVCNKIWKVALGE